VHDVKNKSIELIDIDLLGQIITSEKEDSLEQRKFRPLVLTQKWLEDVFEFDSRYDHRNNMNVYKSPRHGFKIQGVNNRFLIPMSIRKKLSSGGMTGSSVAKPVVLFVNELMLYLFLLERDEIVFDAADIVKINRLIKL